MLKHLLPFVGVLLLCPLTPLVSADAPPSRPNIIIILADDMGFSDIGCFGSEIQTPNLDKLAANGIRFTNFYNMSRCCPSRATILTGLYPHQTGVGGMTGDAGLPGYQGRLNDRCVTIAEVLRKAGYFTAICGKWHVGGNSFQVTPWMRGFDHGIAAPHGGFYYPGPANRKHDAEGGGLLWIDGKNVPNDSPELPKNWYTTDLFTDYAIKYVNEAVAEKKPFFIYLAHTAPHWILKAPAEDVAKYRGKYMAGWDKLREQRYRWQVDHGIIDPSWPLSPLPQSQRDTDNIAPWDTLSAEEKDRQDQIMSLYAACVDHLDQSVGRLVEDLKKQGVYENTLILFLSDNGGCSEGGPYGKLKENKDGETSNGPGAMCGQAWATLENTPFRYYKHWEHEGGISTPFIAHWPAGIRNPGTLCKDRGHIIDIMPTCADVAGAKYPEESNGNKIPPMEGKSLAPALTGGKLVHESLCWEHVGNQAILEGDWKLVSVKGGPWELYNLAKDRTELHDLAAQEPAKVAELSAKWEAWAKRTGVFPKPGKEQKQMKKAAKEAGNNEGPDL